MVVHVGYLIRFLRMFLYRIFLRPSINFTVTAFTIPGTGQSIVTINGLQRIMALHFLIHTLDHSFSLWSVCYWQMYSKDYVSPKIFRISTGRLYDSLIQLPLVLMYGHILGYDLSVKSLIIMIQCWIYFDWDSCILK